MQEFLNKFSIKSLILSVVVIFACGSSFELIEWLFVEMVNPQLGAAYLGLQGDIWDAQKDMILVLLGAILAAILIRIKIGKKQ